MSICHILWNHGTAIRMNELPSLTFVRLTRFTNTLDIHNVIDNLDC